MKNLNNLNVEELNIDEAQKIYGGENILEYIAQGLGYLMGTITWNSNEKIPYGARLEAQQRFVLNSGGMKM